MEQFDLFPSVDDIVDSDILEDDEEVVGYKMAPFFDSTTGEFMFNGNGQIADADGIEGWKQWCENIVNTERFVHSSYSTDIGIDYYSIFALESREEIELALETEISDALMCDPFGRVAYVQGVEFEWISADSVYVTIDIVGIDNELINVNATLSAS